MPRKRYKPEEIVVKLRQIDVLVSQGQSIADAIRQIGVSEVSARRAAQWRDVVHAAGSPDRGHGGGNGVPSFALDRQRGVSDAVLANRMLPIASD
jgi:hypothetical protein